MSEKKPKPLSKRLEELGTYQLCDPDCWGRCRECPLDVIKEAIQRLKELGE